MLAEGGDILHVKFVERDDAVDGLRSRGVAHRVDQALERQLFRHGENFIDTFEWPIGVAELFDGQEKHAAADRFASADEFLTLFEGHDTKDGYRSNFRHPMLPDEAPSQPPVESPSNVRRARSIQRSRP